jgi:hypothetical protein
MKNSPKNKKARRDPATTKPPTPSPAATPSSSAGMAGRRTFLLVMLVGLALGLVTLVGTIAERRHRTQDSPASVGDVFHCRPGPWGDLECTRIVTEPPEGFVPAEWNVQPARWFFKQSSRQQVEDLFRRADLTSAQRRLLAEAKWEESADGVVVTPSRDLVVDLSPEARAAVYGVLGMYPENRHQFQPFRYPANATAEWFADSGLRPETEARVKRLLYRRGRSAVFSDADVVIPYLSGFEEQFRLLKTLARRRTLLVKLHIEPGADARPLADYWSVGNRSKDIYPLLASLARQPAGADIGIVHLLPRFARELLYTYPRPDGQAGELERDSFWTSLNFLRYAPDNGLAGNEEAVRKALDQDFEVVDSASKLGDVIVFFSPDGSLVHSCVYVADDIVFTKNGKGWGVAWILMTYENVLSFYSTVVPITVKVYRAKPPA